MLRKLDNNQLVRTPLLLSPSNIIVLAVESGYFPAGRASLGKTKMCTMELSVNLEFYDGVQFVFGENEFGPTKAKRFSMDLVEGDSASYRFALVLL